MKARGRLFGICLLLLFWCEYTSSLMASSPLIQEGKIALPPGWDDAIIDRIKAGRSPKMVVAVLEFEGSDKLVGKVDVNLSDMLTTSLVKSNRFEVVEREKIDKILKEQSFQVSGLVDETKAVEAGKLLGAEYVVFGSITSVNQTKIDKFAYDVLRTEISVDLRVVSTGSGRIVLSESAAGSVENKLITTAEGVLVSGSTADNAAYASAVRSAVDQAAEKIAYLGPLVGFVIDVSKEVVTVDVGEEQGAKKGFRFVVFRVGDEIIHPVTKRHIGWKKQIICLISISTTEKSMSAGSIEERENDLNPQPGDYVILQKSAP
jgi:curli biogenesis system outer membrane secretion channel CsgG